PAACARWWPQPLRARPNGVANCRPPTTDMRRSLILVQCCLLAACGGTARNPDDIAAQVQAAREPAEARAGDLLLRASIAPTSALGDAIAQRYGVSANPHSILLLVGARRIEGGSEVPIPAHLRVVARDLRGVRTTVPLHEVR